MHTPIYFILAVLASVMVINSHALPEKLSLNVTNTVTLRPALLQLERYDLRSPRFEVRIYSDATNYSTLPASAIPEPATYRGRIADDPGAAVVGAFSTDGSFYFTVTYGCRDTYQGNQDPYDGTNRTRWGGWFGGRGTRNPNEANQFSAAFENPGDGRVAYNVATTNIPSLGYTYAHRSNMPQTIAWSWTNYPTTLPGPHAHSPFEHQQKVPPQRVRLIMDMDDVVLSNVCKGDISFAIAMQESRLNDVDYQQARDFGICHQLVALCFWPNGGRNSDLGAVTGFWNSRGKGTLFDMVTCTRYQYSGKAWVPGEYSVVDPFFSGAVMGHEMFHNWGANHGSSPYDYTGDNVWINSMTLSAYGHGAADVSIALKHRRNWRTWFEWVDYNSPVAPWATPDFATTAVGAPVTVDVLLNDYIATSNSLSIVSFETNTPAGGSVTSAANGELTYRPRAGFAGYDLFHYYVGEPSGLKSLSAVKVLVRNPSDPLLAHWSFNQKTGKTVAEHTGNAKEAVLAGNTTFSGAGNVQGIGSTNRALHLNGGGFVRMQGTWCDPLNSSMSISLWCRPDAPQKGNQSLFSKCTESGWRIGLNGNSFYCAGATFGGLNAFNATANIPVTSNTWYHVVGVVDRDSNTVRLYVNGLEYVGSSIPAGALIAGEIYPSLGKDNATTGEVNFTGAIADVRLYTTALSTRLVQDLYRHTGVVPAGNPNPADAQANVSLNPVCTWSAGATAQHDVYFGTDPVIANATTNSSHYKGVVRSSQYQPSNPLEANTTYYWRVDARDEFNSIVPGRLWRFTTAKAALHSDLRWYLSLDRHDTKGNITQGRVASTLTSGGLFGNPTQTLGKFREAFLFNGTNQFIETLPANVTTSNATFLAWVKPAGAIPEWAGIVFTRDHAGVGRGLIVGPQNELRYGWNAEDWSWRTKLQLTNELWTLVAVVITPTNSVIYQGLPNGELSSISRTVTNPPYALNGKMRVGSDSWVQSRIFSGSIDETAFWARALNPSEIRDVAKYGIKSAAQ